MMYNCETHEGFLSVIMGTMLNKAHLVVHIIITVPSISLGFIAIINLPLIFEHNVEEMAAALSGRTNVF